MTTALALLGWTVAVLGVSGLIVTAAPKAGRYGIPVGIAGSAVSVVGLIAGGALLL